MVSRKQFGTLVWPALGVAAVVFAATPGTGASGIITTPKKFYADDPLLREPAPRAVQKVATRQVDDIFDFLENSYLTPRREGKEAKRDPHSAANINTLGEVPDSPWYTNRHYFHRMTIEELQRGPGNGNPPTGGLRIISAKSDGVMPGFVVEDARRNRFVVKFDPPQYPELCSGPDVIGSKIFYALGYNTPENYIVHFRREDLQIGEGVMYRSLSGKKHPLTPKVLDELLKGQPKGPGGTYRAMASKWIPGQVVGPFNYEGMRSDDPNDIVTHQDRRELRGLRVFAAWLNHEDTRSVNSMDTLVSENAVQYIKHYLIDFGSTLGSAGVGPKLAWHGHAYVLERKATAVQAVTLGLHPPRWARSEYRNYPGVGMLDYESFDPVSWKPSYPNPAFLLLDREDAFWAAKQVAAFSDDEIRALVKTGEYTDPRAADWIAECLIKRRDKIAATWFAPVLALDKFRVADGELGFDDLGASRPGGAARVYRVQWAKYDQQGKVTPLSSASGRQIPAFNATEYLAATISCGAGSGEACPEPVRVYLRRAASGVEVVGIDR